MGTPECVAAHVALHAPLWALPRSVDRPIRSEGCAARVKPTELARVASLPVGRHVGAAPAGITVRIAILVTRRERQTGSPVPHSIHLPAADDIVERLGDV